MRLIWLLGMMAAALLTGCGALPAEERMTGTVETELSESLLQTDAAPAPEDEAETLRLMPEEEVLRAYDHALEAWSWFSTAPLPHGSEAVEIGGETYWKVITPRFRNINDLKAHLQWIFSEELTEQLLCAEEEVPPYLDVEDALYVRGDLYTPRDRSKGSQQLQVERESETLYSVNITVDLLDSTYTEVEGLEFWSFPYELLEDRWVFTSFAGIS